MEAVWFVRHGATEWNRQHRLQGQTDIGLSDEGHAQVRRLAERLAGLPITSIYSSDLLRARQTAGPIAAAHGATPLLSADLREVSLGDWEGLTPDDIRARWGEATLAAYQGDPTTNPPPGAEDRAAVEERVHRAVDAAVAVARCAAGPVLVVGHGGTLRTAICRALGAPPDLARRMWLDNASISRIDLGGRLPRLVGLNDTAHLGTGR